MEKVMRVKLDRDAHLPTRAHRTDAGLDLYSREDKTIYPAQCIREQLTEHAECFDTGVHIELPRGCYGKIESKSGLNVNYNIVSCGGVIDEGYTGSIVVKLYNMGTYPYTVHKGDKIAQLVIMPYLTPQIAIARELEDTERGVKGFGSTGR